MKGLNKIQVIGHVGNAPQVKIMDDGTARTRFSVAINHTWKDANGQRQQDTEWVSIVAWGKLAEIAGEYLDKGRLVYIEGRLQLRTWQDEGGDTRYYTNVVAHELLLLDSRRSDDQAEDTADEQAASASPPPPRRSAQEQRTTRRNTRRPANADEWEGTGL